MKMLKINLQGLVFAFALGCASSTSAGPALWIGDGLGNLGYVDVTTGSQTFIGNMGDVMTDIAFDPSGNLYGITTSALYRINTSNASTTLVGSFGAYSAYGTFNSLVFDNSGTLYAGAGGYLFNVSTTTGAASYRGYGGCPAGCMSSSGDLAFVGGNLYLTSDHYGNDDLWIVSTSGSMTSSNTYPINYYGSGGPDIRTGSTYYTSVFGLASPDHTVLYGVDGTTILQINTSNATATVLSDYYSPAGGLGAAFGAAFYSESGAVLNPVPEPEIYAMLSIGLGLMGWIGRRGKLQAV